MLLVKLYRGEKITKKVLEKFIKEGNLNKRQKYIIRTRAKGYSIATQTEDYI